MEKTEIDTVMVRGGARYTLRHRKMDIERQTQRLEFATSEQKKKGCKT